MPRTTESDISTNMERLAAPYPGRGIIIGRSPDEAATFQLYWVMGRSENSRNRLLVRDGDVVRTEAFDPSKVVDPSLIIYNAMATVRNAAQQRDRVKHVVSNGDQTDTVVEYLRQGRTIAGALATREYEPDAPNYTPRITGITIASGSLATTHALSVISRGESGEVRRQLYAYRNDTIEPGTGLCVHTYDIGQQPGEPLPSFQGLPLAVDMAGNSANEVGQAYWDLLDKKNRVALVAKRIPFIGGQLTYALFNQLES